MEWERLECRKRSSICRHDWASVDLFASSDNVKRARFEFWQPDSLAWKVETLSIVRDLFLVLIYDLPPFSLIGSVLRKIEGNQAQENLKPPKAAVTNHR